MPKKALYLSKEDLPLWKRVKELYGNHSPLIIRLLRREVEIHDAALRACGQGKK